jgi:hypothetical protein
LELKIIGKRKGRRQRCQNKKRTRHLPTKTMAALIVARIRRFLKAGSNIAGCKCKNVPITAYRCLH